MPPTSEECERKEDLQFLEEMKHEAASIVCEDVQTSSGARVQDSLYLGMRRNSSFADYFEGDLSQNLLSRRHFLHANDVSSTGAVESEKQIVNGILDQIKSESQRGADNKPGWDGKLRKLSEVE